jgi:hypothetical protein
VTTVQRANVPTSDDDKGSDRTPSRHSNKKSIHKLYISNMAPHLDPSQTRTPLHLTSRPQKSALIAEFAGKHLQELRTPALVIDRHVFSKNCAKMHANAAGYGAAFRAHLKTHKVTIVSDEIFEPFGTIVPLTCS